MRLNPLSVYVLICGVLLLGLALFAWKRRATQGARLFWVFVLAQAVYVLGASLELSLLELPDILFWSKFQFIGVYTFPTLFLIFVLDYIGRSEWLTPRNLGLAFSIPLVLLFFKFTDDHFRLVYTTVVLDTSGLFPVASFTPGPLYHVSAIYNIVPYLIGNLLLLYKSRHASSLFRRQANLIIISSLVPFVVYLVYLSGLQPFALFKNIDLFPFVYPFWVAGVGWGLFRHRLLDLSPIARDFLVENLTDGMMVLDENSRLVDANPAAHRLFGWQKIPVGGASREIFSEWSEIADLCQPRDSSTFARRFAQVEIRHEREGQVSFYDVSVNPLKNKKGVDLGYLVLAHDITELKLTQEKLHELSLVDDLTGLNNRRGFNLFSTQMFHVAQNLQQPMLLIYADLDGLKELNDQLGHAVGDQALVDTAQLFKAAFRSSDTIARIGGDEFLILAIVSCKAAENAILERLHTRLEEINQQANRAYSLSISFGTACYHPEAPRPLDELISEADQVMYRNKAAKKSAMTFFPTA